MKLRLALFAACAMTASAVGAQYERMSASETELRENMCEYAKCMVLYNHVDARKLVVSNTPNDRLEFEFDTIYTSKPLALVPGCRRLVIRTDYALVLQPDMLRSYLAEELIIADLKIPETGNFANRAPLSHWPAPSASDFESQRNLATDPKRRAQIEQEYSVAYGRVWLSHYGECVVRSNSKSAHEWIVAKPDSSQAAAAIDRLRPALGACLAEGESLKFGKDVLRGALAVSYYRLAMAAPVVTNGVAQ